MKRKIIRLKKPLLLKSDEFLVFQKLINKIK